MDHRQADAADRVVFFGSVAIAALLIAISVTSSEPEWIDMLAAEQTLGETDCTQLPHGDWHCRDVQPVRMSWRAEQ